MKVTVIGLRTGTNVARKLNENLKSLNFYLRIKLVPFFLEESLWHAVSETAWNYW